MGKNKSMYFITVRTQGLNIDKTLGECWRLVGSISVQLLFGNLLDGALNSKHLFYAA